MKKYIVTFKKTTYTHHPIGDGEVVKHESWNTVIVPEDNLEEFIKENPNIRNCQVI